MAIEGMTYLVRFFGPAQLQHQTHFVGPSWGKKSAQSAEILGEVVKKRGFKKFGRVCFFLTLPQLLFKGAAWLFSFLAAAQFWPLRPSSGPTLAARYSFWHPPAHPLRHDYVLRFPPHRYRCVTQAGSTGSPAPDDDFPARITRWQYSWINFPDYPRFLPVRPKPPNAFSFFLFCCFSLSTKRSFHFEFSPLAPDMFFGGGSRFALCK